MGHGSERVFHPCAVRVCKYGTVALLLHVLSRLKKTPATPSVANMDVGERLGIKKRIEGSIQQVKKRYALKVPISLFLFVFLQCKQVTLFLAVGTKTLLSRRFLS